MGLPEMVVKVLASAASCASFSSTFFMARSRFPS